MFGLQALLLLCISSASSHIVVITADDWGWYNFELHNAQPTKEVVTPRMAALARDGILLERHYAYMYCSPSRSAFHTGRNPIHVNVWNDECVAGRTPPAPPRRHDFVLPPPPPLSPLTHTTSLRVSNASETQWGQGGIPRSMTGLAAKLAGAGFAAHHVGKWHGGLGHSFSTPVGRGFRSSFGYLGAVNDYFDMSAWEQCPQQALTQDLWYQNASAAGPAFDRLNRRSCSAAAQNTSGCVHEEYLFRAQALGLIAAHDAATPLFLNYAPHLVHSPLEAPAVYLEKFAFIPDKARAAYAAMVNMLDDVVGDVADALKARGMWDTTLLLVFSDNGGPVYLNGSSGANNYPLRGGKVSNWDGGVRTNAFLSGGLVPAAKRGTTHNDLVACWDWYSSLCGLAGVAPADGAAAAAGLPPIDSVDQLPYIFGANATPPRAVVELGVTITPGEEVPPFKYNLANGSVYVGGIVTRKWKLLVGAQFQSVWTGAAYPNGSTWEDVLVDCGGGLPFPGRRPAAPPQRGCLYDLENDPLEALNVADANPAVVEALNATIVEAQKGVIAYLHGSLDPAACDAAYNASRRGVIGPWLAD